MKYLLISTVCISIFYIAYRIVFRKETNFRQLRVYLLLSIFISGLIPLSNFSIDLNLTRAKETFNVVVENQTMEKVGLQDVESESPFIVENEKTIRKSIHWLLLLKRTYRIVGLILILRIFVQVLYLFYKYFISEKVVKGKLTLIYNHGFKNSFSFFNWIFINDEKSSEEDLQKIIAHEMVHVNQYHSIDLLIIELLSAVMWFNPFVWMMRNSVQLVHEYLADEGVLKNGVDKINYQALLINLVTEEKLIRISSSFNQSLIKKRMIMMNKIKLNKGFSFKFLALLPLATFLFFGVACVKGQESAKEEKLEGTTPIKTESVAKVDETNNEIVAAIALTKMNVLYVGVDNPVQIAVSGYNSSEVKPSITNGSIRSQGNGNYIINPKRPGNSVMNIWVNGEVVQNTSFRVREIPNPIARVGRHSGGEIDKNFLLEYDQLEIFIPNFDFDLKFETKEFVVSTTDPKGYVIDSWSDSNRITKTQKELIKNSKVGQRIIFEDIKAIGPDGSIRNIPSIVFELM